MNDLEVRLLSLSDKEIFELIADDSKMYSDEAVQIAREITHIRGLTSELGEEFKVITNGGRENGPLDVLIIKSLFLKKLITPESLLYVDARQQWLPLREVFDIARWGEKSGQTEAAEPIKLIKAQPVESIKPVHIPEPVQVNEDIHKTNPSDEEAPAPMSAHFENTGTVKTKQERMPAFIANNMGDESLAQYRGAGGWLILFALFMVIWRLYGIWLLQAQLLGGPRNVYNFGMASVAIEYVIGLIAVILLIFESKKAVLFTKLYLAGLLIFNVGLLVTAMQSGGGENTGVLSANKIYLTTGEHIMGVLKELGLGRFITLEPSVVQTAGIAILVILAFLYFTTSKRVRATYTDVVEID